MFKTIYTSRLILLKLDGDSWGISQGARKKEPQWHLEKKADKAEDLQHGRGCP